MTDNVTSLPVKKWALVVTHMLNPNLVQGFPMYRQSAEEIRAMVEECLNHGWSVPITDDQGAVQLNVLLGGGMSYMIEDWGSFAQRMADMQAQQAAQMKANAEAEAAARFGVAGGPPRRIGR